ncbi:hypothetical protein BV25DRAFT_1811128 [Artomyces pyxidatus]|uniref:Uncharacterized protein n=1 Tax=Artomyces pyxidatus TaxID=48021 RepID=A0ACB8SNX9_9AGAM|nr:hypothetical protein BV25DRAFT_1811128 [Artomyces pyxidatus]
MSSHQLDYNAYTYLTVVFHPSSPHLSNPSALTSRHQGLIHVGPVGELHDVQIYGVPKQSWDQSSGAILAALNSGEGVLKVEAQEPRVRSKRG